MAWKIRDKNDKEKKNATPKVGQIYKIKDVRKGTFNGKILTNDKTFVEVEITEGEAHYLTRPTDTVGDIVIIRDSLCTLYEI